MVADETKLFMRASVVIFKMFLQVVADRIGVLGSVYRKKSLQVVADENGIFRTIFKNISQVVADENGVLDTIFEKIHKKLKNNEKKS